MAVEEGGLNNASIAKALVDSKDSVVLTVTPAARVNASIVDGNDILFLVIFIRVIINICSGILAFQCTHATE